MAQGNTLLNAVIGAVVTVVFTFLPFSPVVGGSIAGYLQGGDQSAAIRVGTLSGVLAAIPLVVVLMLLATIVPFLPAFGTAGSITAVFGVLGIVALVISLFYSVGLSVLGALLGRYLSRETGR
ncbi:hypothetical protein HLRTI_001679 [Halorhabdus tiamatea SARL4B]|uniref:DUF5518 domain-containing protein n=1 Tax=Halorhabdus tiamatea SARL4B TaxID=1033806 RepID=F7PNK1_9EURY|nr:DUF5518 domain-containing protein [Halorhabdus tiamatea]ERJ06200.1 hypothetical protein HLRTI_001679 [Halorhabdus tiamatea SARL4B]CCQ33762.1 conserved hypothetical protein [Halorhabdus tiamatea SARL4B]